MIFQPVGTRILSLRKARGLSQSELAARCGIGRERLSNFERGMRRPAPDHLTRLATALGIEESELVRNTDWLPPEEREMLKRASARVSREFFRPYVYVPPRDRDMSTQLRKAMTKYTELTRSLFSLIRKRPDGNASLRVLSTVVAGSALEVIVHLLLLAMGSIVWVAPEPLGFRRHPVVDPRTREGVGSRDVPAYRVDLGGLRCLFIPQVGLACRRATWRVDFLCAVIDPQGAVFWLYVEIDGEGHDGSSDAFRSADIDMPVIRLYEEDILGATLLACLEARIKHHLNLAA